MDRRLLLKAVIGGLLLFSGFSLWTNAFSQSAGKSNLFRSFSEVGEETFFHRDAKWSALSSRKRSAVDSLEDMGPRALNVKQTQQAFTDYAQPIPNSDQSIEMVAVAGGTFLMGPSRDNPGSAEDDGPPHRVKVDSFWIGKYEITWEQYTLFIREALPELRKEINKRFGDPVVSADAVSTPTPPYTDMSFGMGKDGYPAINMTQYAVVMFAKWLTALTGRFYRLPTEAEWEYACRGGSDTPYHFGESPGMLDRFAWYRENSGKQYHKVGTKAPSPFGLHDMHGNVAEWTMDQFYENYFEKLEEEPADNPWFKPTKLYPRSVRGGSWQGTAEEQRCTHRRGSRPKWKRRDPQMPKSKWWLTNASFLGFRIVRPAETPSREKMKEFWIEAMEDLN